jgi:hypothetical protein
MNDIIAYYDKQNNPWHEWIMDSVAEELHEWIRKTQSTNRLVEKGQWDTYYQYLTLEEFITDNGLDREAAYEAWIAYENFKADLTEYRMARYAKTSQ